MVLDANGEDDDLDELDRALAAEMEESHPIYSSTVNDTPLDEAQSELEEKPDGPD
jgi:hypothetical protein